MDSDFFLIRKMRQGDEEAFDIFIRKYYGDILRYCACHCFDAEDAQDRCAGSDAGNFRALFLPIF